ncbi:7-carboxy-7-deazaguanine synthase QueE [Candidatus Acidianus copahuensis]|uniref:7-carboxy-7-deazaguanine synthase n=1 Tax=Candidatus Acidianus copahuensis TaxID=1160895 RepID=A0A031LPV6_9CREN|nr:7-carboxy-7-deazaguanine synthase QueE [Candidatus Acidianus copahuensis]EZQ04838.1 radical SAM protein [Candidatus Acidianus copahuensis]NON62796.1 7-carboxy-7-deazaguanine synthase QueE [Acidianus sp. RZ1]
MEYRVIEIFSSIQGEGEVIGVPSNFIRLATCNLRCVWCDTKYSWEKGELISIEEIIKRLDKTLPATTITGGEPLLQNIVPLALAIKEMGQRIVVETNGTIKPHEELRKIVDVFSVSPKLSNSGHKIAYNFTDDWATYYKFVILYTRKDLEEVVRFVEENGIRKDKVIVQPDGNRKDYEIALKELAEAVMDLRLPFRVLPQLHRIISFR